MSDHDRNVDRQMLNARRSYYVPQKADGRTAIARPQTSPFTSPSKRSARFAAAAAAAAASSAAEAAANGFSNGTKRRPDCTCSDLQIEMGGCICAASSASDASSSSSSSLSPTVGSKGEWRRYDNDNIAREMRYGAAGAYESGADTREGTLSSSALRAGQNDSSNTRRWQPNANRLPPTSPSRSLRDVLNRIEARRAAASNSSPSPSADAQGKPTDDNSALFTARRARVNSRDTSLAWSRSDVPTPSQTSMVSAAKARNRQMSAASTVSGDLENDDVEWQRRRRREERDRLIRRRIEEKKRRASGGSTVVANGDHSMRSAATPTTTRRNLNDDLELLQRISRPPRASSVAAFAATVSPPKKGRRTNDAASWPSSEDGASPRISSESPGKISASPATASLLSGLGNDRAAEDSQSETNSSLTSQSSDDGFDGPVSREPPTNSSPAASRSSKSPGAFHFTPQRMSKEIVHPPEEVASTSASPTSSTFTSSSLSPPQRRNAHRRGQESSSSVVAVSARLPPATPLEAQRRLQRALGTSEADLDLPQSLDADDARMPAHSVLQNESQSLASRSVKSVRFHTSAELIAPGGEAVTVQEQLHSGRGERDRSELVEENDLSESRRETESASDIDDEESALATSRRTSKADSTAPSTPMRLIPGGFGTPLVNLGLNYSGADGTSFSRHVLRPTPKKQGAATPSTKAHGHLSSATGATESPLLPGGLRLRQWTEASNVGRVDADESHQASISPSPRKCPSQGRSKDRSLPPPSYWAIAPSTKLTAQTDPAAVMEFPAQVGEQVVSELPRTSTPPPSSKEDMSRGADASNFDLAASLSHHLHDVDDIPSSSASSTSSSAASEAAEAPATPKADHSVEVADDSLKVTLDRFVEMVRSNGKGESRGVDLEHTDVSAAKQASEASLVALARRLEEIHMDEEAARERSEEQKKHDAESLTRIEAAGRSLSEQVEAALISGVIDHKDGADEQVSRRYISTRPYMAAGCLALQLCLIWVSLAVARSGAEQLYRTVYFDAFYPHLYGNGNAAIDFASVPPRAGMVIVERHGWSSLARTFEAVALRALAGLVEAIFANSAGSAAVTLPFVPI